MADRYWKSRFDTPLKLTVAIGLAAWIGEACLYMVRKAELRRVENSVGVPVMSPSDEIQLVALPVEYSANEVRMQWRLCASEEHCNLAGTSGTWTMANGYRREVDELLLFAMRIHNGETQIIVDAPNRSYRTIGGTDMARFLDGRLGELNYRRLGLGQIARIPADKLGVFVEVSLPPEMVAEAKKQFAPPSDLFTEDFPVLFRAEIGTVQAYNLAHPDSTFDE